MFGIRVHNVRLQTLCDRFKGDLQFRKLARRKKSNSVRDFALNYTKVITLDSEKFLLIEYKAKRQRRKTQARIKNNILKVV
jgi:hypothetical protein